MTVYGIQVDEQAIARGLLRLCEEAGMDDELAAIGLGMTPAKVMLPLERMLGEKFDSIAYRRFGTPEEIKAFEEALGVEGIVTVDTMKRKHFVNEVVRAVHCQMLKLGGCVV